MDEQYLVDVDKQPIRNAIFRTLAGVISAGSLFVFWSDGVQIYETGWAHFDISSGLWTLVSVPAVIVMGLFAIGDYDALNKPHRALDESLQRLLDPNCSPYTNHHPFKQVNCARRKKLRKLFGAKRGLRPWQ